LIAVIAEMRLMLYNQERARAAKEKAEKETAANAKTLA